MSDEILENLVDLSRPPRPSQWLATMAPLAKRAGIVTLRRLQQIADYERTSNLITQISTRALAPRLTPEAMVHVGQLARLGVELRFQLDATFSEMKDTMRELVAAQRQEDFISAAARVERLLPLAEASCDKVDDFICTIGVLASKLAAAPMLSDSLVLPTPLAGFVAEPTTAAR